MIDVQVDFEDENKKVHTIITGINGTIEDAKKYYLGKQFNIGNINDLMAIAIKVEEV